MITTTNKKKEDLFKDTLEDLFDIAHLAVLQTIKR